MIARVYTTRSVPISDLRDSLALFSTITTKYSAFQLISGSTARMTDRRRFGTTKDKIFEWRFVTSRSNVHLFEQLARCTSQRETDVMSASFSLVKCGGRACSLE